MKWLVLLLVVLGAMSASAQKIDFETRVKKYVPILEPRPCSVWMVEWGASKSEVLKEAKRLGMLFMDSSTTTDGTSLMLTFQEPDKELYYTFVVGKVGFKMFICQMSFNSAVDAQARVDEVSRDFIIYWDSSSNSSSNRYQSVCKETSESVGASVSRNKATVMLSAYVLK